MSSIFTTYYVTIVAIMVSVIVIYIASMDSKSTTNSYNFYVALSVIPILVASGFILFSNIISAYTIAIAIMILILFSTIYYFTTNITKNSSQYATYITYIFAFITAIICLAIIYKLFIRVIQNTHGWISFLFKFIFYIPCILIDIVEILFVDFKNTNTTVKFLLAIEFIIILLYLYISNIIRNKSESVLLSGPVHLNKSKVIANSDITRTDISTQKDPNEIVAPSSDQSFRRNYAISLWTYINTSNSTHGKPVSIFTYGNANRADYVGTPSILYDQTTQQLNIFFSNTKHKNGTYVDTITLDITGQSWHNIVINYNNNICDVFLDAKLINSLNMQTVPSYTVGDNFYVGEEDGLYGSVCNVRYYQTPLTLREINTHYNMYMYKNPPV